MKKLKRLMLYKERDYSNNSAERLSVEENTFVLSESRAREIADYLKSGIVLVEFLSSMRAPFFKDDLIRNVTFSDGEYVWDYIIVNWVEKYRIRLPKEFLCHFDSMKGQPMPINDGDAGRLLASIHYTEDIWMGGS